MHSERSRSWRFSLGVGINRAKSPEERILRRSRVEAAARMGEIDLGPRKINNMDIKSNLEKFGLNPENSVIIGSGILSALHLRESKDIDVVTTVSKYESLHSTGIFAEKQNHGRNVLVNDLLEIGTNWGVLGKTWQFQYLVENSVVIYDVRYNSVEFLLNAKRQWVADGEGRVKDIEDIKLMEEYLKKINQEPCGKPTRDKDK